MRKVTKKLIKQVMDGFEHRGIKFSEKKLLHLLKNNKGLQDDWNAVGDYDTVFRERLVQAIAEDCEVKANEGRWPAYCDTPKNSKAFFKELREKAPAHEYEIHRNVGK